MEKQRYTIEQAADLLGVGRSKLWRLMKLLEITHTTDRLNRRFHFITADDVQVIRAELERFDADVVVKPKEPRHVAAPLNLPPAPIPLPESTHRAPTGHRRPPSDKPRLPDEWMSLTEAMKLAGINSRWDMSTLRQWATPGNWLYKRARVSWALSPEQQEAFFAHFGRNGEA